MADKVFPQTIIWLITHEVPRPKKEGEYERPDTVEEFFIGGEANDAVKVWGELHSREVDGMPQSFRVRLYHTAYVVGAP